MRRYFHSGLVILLAVVALVRPTSAGFATRLFVQFDIGAARSLPWDDSCCGRRDYDIARLQSDTDALLTPSTPIILRLETLRRAVIYASSDRHVARRLLITFSERARAAEHSRRPDAMAYLDAAFVTEALREIGGHSNMPFSAQARQVQGLVGEADGYELVRRGVALRPNDAEFEFAAALIAGVNHLGGAAFMDHARKAIAGAAGDPLLSRNLNRIYADRLSGLERPL
jgi:hypothetical protein